MSWRRNRPSASAAALAPAVGDDESLVRAAQRGDLDAYNRLVRAHERQAYAVALRLLRRPEQAEDATQDAFIQAYRALDTFRGGSFRAWLMRIVTNRCYDMLRSAQPPCRRLARRSDCSRRSRTGAAPPRPMTRSGARRRRNWGGCSKRRLPRSPDDQRVTVLLCDVQGYAYEEVAQITGVALGTVKSRLSRARAALRDGLRGQEQFAEYLRSFL